MLFRSSGPNIYVNLPGLKQIAAINRQTGAITRWPIKEESNFPMALDEANHRLFAVTRAPARLLVLDTGSGHVVATLPCVQDSDDLYYDAARKRIYAAGGEGYISVFQQQDADHTACWRRSLPSWEREPQGILESWGRDSTASLSRFRRALTTAPRS